MKRTALCELHCFDKGLSVLDKCVRVLRKSQRSSNTGTEQTFLIKIKTEALWERTHIEHTKEIVCTVCVVCAAEI